MTDSSPNRIKPDFLIIGAQKAGTTWLWKMLQQHPGVDMPREKEIHFFGSAELYRKGMDYYLAHFARLDRSKKIGEAAPTNFYDYVPYWHNQSHELEIDRSLPSIPELITTAFPNVKILVILRDPVHRAVSAYLHWMRDGHWMQRRAVSPLHGLRTSAIQYPKTRVLEFGYYARYLRLWRQFVPHERMRVLVFEEDVCRFPEKTLYDVFTFLDLDPRFQPRGQRERVHASWSWTRILLHYYADPFSRKLIRSRYGRQIDRADVLRRFSGLDESIDFLRAAYLPEKAELEFLLGRSLSCWSYGARGTENATHGTAPESRDDKAVLRP